MRGVRGRGRLISNPWGLTPHQLVALRAVSAPSAVCACGRKMGTYQRAALQLAVSVPMLDAHLARCRAAMSAIDTATAVRMLRAHEAQHGPLATDG